jgi:EF-P beta-lysylation protein EpmB
MSLISNQPKAFWKEELARLITDPAELCELLLLKGQDAQTLKEVCKAFPLRVPQPYLKRIKKGCLNDPLLLQVLPQQQELETTLGYSADPLDEEAFTPVQGLLHKYHGRVLIVLNGSCAIHCRYCFRRHFPYQEFQIGKLQWQAILDYIAGDNSIDEVIFSGGDPLTCADKILKQRCVDLEKIPHLQRLRLHTRLPVMIPQRINAAFINWIQATRFETVMVIHSNHAQEIDEEVGQVLLALDRAGVRLLNQSVLLKGINDSADVLAQLSKRLFDCKVMPYYLHLLDRVQGAAHFDSKADDIKQLQADLQALLPGYLMPKFAIEEAHEKNKRTL